MAGWRLDFRGDSNACSKDSLPCRRVGIGSLHDPDPTERSLSTEFSPNRFPLSYVLAGKPEPRSAYFRIFQPSTPPGESPCLGRLIMLQARGNSDTTEK
jgi:hypothetical protein